MRAEPAVSASVTALRPSLRSVLRHWPSAWTWLWACLTVAERRALDRHQLVADRQEVLADDVQAGGRHQVVDVGDAAGDGILDRDHAERHSPDATAAKASSKVAQGSGSQPG